VADAQRGDRAALEALLRRHHDRVAALCTRLCGPSDGPDATQEALVAVVRGLPRFDGHAAFTTWLYRVTTNACLDELRRRRRRPLPGLEEDQRPIDGPAAGPDPSGAVAARVDVDAALARLAPEFRAAVVLRDLCGLDYAEIADVLRIPPGTVRSRIARGRGQLADLLAGNPSDLEPRHIPGSS
jgi:RNA polymerase sigma-70 factor, ECF subfamily